MKEKDGECMLFKNSNDEIQISDWVKEILKRRNKAIRDLKQAQEDNDFHDRFTIPIHIPKENIFKFGRLNGEISVYNDILEICDYEYIDSIITDLNEYYEVQKAEIKRREDNHARFKATLPLDEQDISGDDQLVECISDDSLGSAIFAFVCDRCGYQWKDNFTPSRCMFCGSDEVWGGHGCADCGSTNIGWFCPKCNSQKVRSIVSNYGHPDTVPMDFDIET